MQNPVPNAYTLAIGGRKPFVVVHTALLELLEPLEVQVGSSLSVRQPHVMRLIGWCCKADVSHVFSKKKWTNRSALVRLLRPSLVLAVLWHVQPHDQSCSLADYLHD